jgi:hypothetical protein
MHEHARNEPAGASSLPAPLTCRDEVDDRLAGGAFAAASDATRVVGLLPQIARELSVSAAALGQASAML